mgnify:CR=1 FL=1
MECTVYRYDWSVIGVCINDGSGCGIGIIWRITQKKERVRIDGINYYVTALGSRVFDGVCCGVRVPVPSGKPEEYRKMLQDKGLNMI